MGPIASSLSLGDYANENQSLVNCIVFGDGAEVIQSIHLSKHRLNEIRIQLLDPDGKHALEAMESIPTGWAQISIANLKGFAPRAQAEAAEKLIRLTAPEGIIVIVMAADQCDSPLAHEDFLDNYLSFGLKYLQPGTTLATLTKLSRSPIQSATHNINVSDAKVTYDFKTLLPAMSPAWLHRHSYQTLNDLDWDRKKQFEAQNVEGEIRHIQDLANQKISEYQQNEVNLLKENQEAKASIENLQAQLADMTASFLSMQESLHKITSSRAWKATEWPRRAIDVAKQTKHRFAGKGIIASKISDQQSAVNNTSIYTSDYPPTPAPSPPANMAIEAIKESAAEIEHLHPVWPGTFIDIEDNSINSGRQRRERVLFIDWRVPEPDKDSGSCRIYEILKIAAATGKPVDFAGNEDFTENKYLDLLVEIGIHPILGKEKIVRHLRRFGSQYSVIIICRPDPAAFYAPLARCYCPHARLVFDTVDLHFLRFYRAQILAEENSEEKQQLHSLYLHHYATEKFLAEAFDSTIVVTDKEKELLSEFIDPARVEVIPNIHSISLQDCVPSFQERQGLLFIGSFDHAPNVDAVIYFSEQIMPLVKETLPDIVLYIVGSNMKDNVASLSSDNIKPVGYLEDLTSIYNRTRTFIAPLRYGAGLKGKVGQSMSHGVPVVGTSVAFEGFGLMDREQGLIADSPEDFAAAVVEIYSNPELWQTISGNGQKMIHSRFSSASAQEAIGRIIGND